MAETTKTLSTVGKAKQEILREIGNEQTQKELIETVFKNFDVGLMKRALLEGMLRGFTFKDFLEKNVYAIKYGTTYSLVTSIDHARKRGMKGGIVGTEAPTYTLAKDNGQVMMMKVNGTESDKPLIESCTVTVKKMFDGGHIGEFTATVFFDEYYQAGKTYQGKYTESMWDKKPRTMIAKVAEMHALRKACPDELSQAYVEEEMVHADVIIVPEDTEPEVDEKEVKKVIAKINKFDELADLQAYYAELGKPWVTIQNVIDAYEGAKQKLSDTSA